jgi:hypothetical protein
VSRTRADEKVTTWAVQLAPDSLCASDPNFAAELAEQIPEPQRAAPADAELRAEVRVRRAGKRAWIGEIHVLDRVLESEAGSRELTLSSGSCAESAEALGLVLAVLVEAGRGMPVTEPPAPPPAEEQPPLPPPPPPPPAEPEARQPPPRPAPAKQRYAWLGPRAGHDLHLGVGVGAGLLPGWYLAASLSWGLRLHDLWPLWLSVTALPTKQTADGRAEFSALYAGFFACPLSLERGRWRGRLCPGFSAGALRAEGRGFVESRKSTEVAALLGLDASGDVALLGPWTASLSVRGEVPLVREEFVYYRMDGGEPTLHQPKPVTFVAFLGTGLRFR